MLRCGAAPRPRPKPRLMRPRRRWRCEPEREDTQSHHAHQPERRSDLREVVARQEGLQAAAARCARGRSGKVAGRAGARRSGPDAGSERDRNHPPLHAHLDLELCRRSRHVSAGLVHHEVQRARERICGATDGTGRGASLSAGARDAGRAAHSADAERAAHRDHRHGRDHACSRRQARMASSPAS